MKKYLSALIFVLVCGAYGQVVNGQKKAAAKNQASAQRQYNCLPPEITLDTVASVIRKPSALQGKIEIEYVRQRLVKLNAKCQNGKLIDGKNKEIRFYQLKGCWGNPPSDYSEILENQRKELQQLKRKFTVIELTCNPSGEMPV